MAEIVNLRERRKAAARDARRRKGDENAATFGRTKAERGWAPARADKARADLVAHRRAAPAPISPATNPPGATPANDPDDRPQ